jgi:hypothetical protein
MHVSTSPLLAPRLRAANQAMFGDLARAAGDEQ